MKFSSGLQKLIEEPSFMTLGTLNKDGSIHMTILWYLYEDELFKISTTSDRVKFKNIKRDPKVSFVISDKDDFYKYVQIRGVVNEIETKGGHDFIDRLAKRYLDKEKYPYDTEREEDRVTISIKPDSFFTYGLE